MEYSDMATHFSCTKVICIFSAFDMCVEARVNIEKP